MSQLFKPHLKGSVRSLSSLTRATQLLVLIGEGLKDAPESVHILAANFGTQRTETHVEGQNEGTDRHLRRLELETGCFARKSANELASQLLNLRRALGLLWREVEAVEAEEAFEEGQGGHVVQLKVKREQHLILQVDQLLLAHVHAPLFLD